MAHEKDTPEHLFVPVKGQSGCKRCGYAAGHHPTAAQIKKEKATPFDESTAANLVVKLRKSDYRAANEMFAKLMQSKVSTMLMEERRSLLMEDVPWNGLGRDPEGKRPPKLKKEDETPLPSHQGGVGPTVRQPKDWTKMTCGNCSSGFSAGPVKLDKNGKCGRCGANPAAGIQEDAYEDDLDWQPSCPVCGGEGNFMGQLGSLAHYRCRQCGMDFSAPANASVATMYAKPPLKEAEKWVDPGMSHAAQMADMDQSDREWIAQQQRKEALMGYKGRIPGMTVGDVLKNKSRRSVKEASGGDSDGDYDELDRQQSNAHAHEYDTPEERKERDNARRRPFVKKYGNTGGSMASRDAIKEDTLTEAKVECLECGKVFNARVSPGASPKCPKCGGYDVELAEHYKSFGTFVKEERDYTPRYTVQIFSPGYSYTEAAWEIKQRFGQNKGQVAAGKPTDDNLRTYVTKFEDSTEPGGVNDHLGTRKITRASIKDQQTGDIVATYHAALIKEDFSQDDEPTEDDITTDDHEHFYSSGKKIADSPKEAKAWMKKHNYYPNVWFISDHGNAHLTDILKEAWGWAPGRPDISNCQTELPGGKYCGKPAIAVMAAKRAPDSAAFGVCATHKQEFDQHEYRTLSEDMAKDADFYTCKGCGTKSTSQYCQACKDAGKEPDVPHSIKEDTLDQWAEKQPYALGTKGGGKWMPDGLNLVDRAAAWDLDDYFVSSVSGGTIWFAPRSSAAPGTFQARTA
jgi:hypothetical protein